MLALAVTVPLLALRFFTPYDLQETDQGKQAQYALDAFQNGNWLAPGSLGVAATKPPLYTWLAALVSTVAGGIDELTIRVPTTLAALGLVLVTWDIARRLAGPRVAAAAAVALATSHHFLRLSGVVRTDGLLAFLIAAQVLVYVRSIADDEMPVRAIVASSVLAGCACLAKGPGGLLACATVALHLVATGRGRRAWLSAGVPALVGISVLAAWFLAANETRADVYDTMVGNEFTRNVASLRTIKPYYYLIQTPLRLGPWVAILVPAAWIAVRAIRRRRTEPVTPLVSLACAWFVVVLLTFSFLPHRRPDLIYPAEPALLLLAASMVARPFPAWAPRLAGAALCAAGAAFLSPLARLVVQDEAPDYMPALIVTTLGAGAVAAFTLARRDAGVACFAGLASIGVVDCLVDTVGEAPRVERVSTENFGALVRREAQARRAALVAVGFDKPASLFHFRIATRSLPAGYLRRHPGPLLVVAAAHVRRNVEDAVGPCDVIASHPAPSGGRPPLVLLAPRSEADARR